jgi:RNase adapter protein RapZ
MAPDSTGNQVVLIVTGMSGAGRSTAANSLEDQGWYVVDNLPPQMLSPLVALAANPSAKMPKVAAVMDARGGSLFDDARNVIVELSERGECPSPVFGRHR